MTRRNTVDVFLLQETLLPEGSTTTLLGYRSYHFPRIGRAGGDLAILAQHSIACQQKQPPLSCWERVEVEAVTLRLPSLELIIYNIYRPPTDDLELEELFGLAATEMVLAAGDFNSHYPWLGSPCPSNVAGRQLYVF